ncbi:MAG TPA: hypothetical protein PJ982_01885 [Lacipirellulaceae bacterium]|nr:hypothetical protein [Lacipirellulaceae bacterium]
MIQTLFVAVLTAHLLAANLASGGPLAAAWLGHAAGGRGRALGVRLAWQSLAALGLTAALGGLLLATPGAGLWEAIARFPASTYWFAGVELAFSAVCLAVLAWVVGRGGPTWAAWLLAAASASNLLYHFPPLMTVLAKLAADPRWATAEVITRAELRPLAARPEVLSMWVHVVLASLAVGAAAALWPRSGDDDGRFDRLFGRLALAALAATVVQLPVGLWMLLASEPDERSAMMGRSLAASLSLLLGVMAALGLMHALAALAMGEVEPRSRRRAVGLMAGVVLLMTTTLYASRTRTKPLPERPPTTPAPITAPRAAPG